MSNPLSCNVTGHRKLVPTDYTGGGWWTPTCPVVEKHHKDIKQMLMESIISSHINNGVIEFVSGGAIGADILFAEAVILIRDYGYPITLGIAIPFPSQSCKWGTDTVARYNKVLEAANWVYEVSPDPYTPQKMQSRNEWMVNRCGILLAVWNGVTKGGTWNCVNYAQKQGREILTINV